MKHKTTRLILIIGGIISLLMGIYGMMGFDKSIYSIFSIVAGVFFIGWGLFLRRNEHEEAHDDMQM